ncbi:MAG: hypothetical protein HC803_08325 [Saprospiraceae bacterium]|nr:hypothetical protein [Saprospiraceae bacterium]
MPKPSTVDRIAKIFLNIEQGITNVEVKNIEQGITNVEVKNIEQGITNVECRSKKYEHKYYKYWIMKRFDSVLRLQYSIFFKKIRYCALSYGYAVNRISVVN